MITSGDVAIAIGDIGDMLVLSINDSSRGSSVDGLFVDDVVEELLSTGSLGTKTHQTTTPAPCHCPIDHGVAVVGVGAVDEGTYDPG